MRTRVLAAAAIIAASIPAMANDNLDRVFESMENEPGAKVTVNEQRDPDTGKKTRHSWYIECPSVSEQKAQQCINAFKKEREKAIKYTQYNSDTFMVQFKEGDMLYMYSLTYTPKKTHLMLMLSTKPYVDK